MQKSFWKPKEKSKKKYLNINMIPKSMEHYERINGKDKA